MQDQSSTVCFSCGQAVGFPARINHRSDGSVCQPCADRALGSIPAALPRSLEALDEALDEAQDEVAADDARGAQAQAESLAELHAELDDPDPDVPA